MHKPVTVDMENYARWKSFLVIFCDKYFNASVVPEDQRPAAFLEKLEKVSMVKAGKSLIMGVQDCVNFASSWPIENILEADEYFRQHGAATLLELFPKFSKKYSKILNRGKISSDVEYLFLKGFCEDGAIPESDLKQVRTLLDAYESSAVKRHP